MVNSVVSGRGWKRESVEWPSGVQVHADLLNLDEEQFLAQYPPGKEFRMELTVRVMDHAPYAVVSEQVGRVK